MPILLAVYFQKRELVIPGQVLAEGKYRAGEGTYFQKGRVISSLVGLAELKNNVIRVVPLQGVYIPRVGDVVIGTIIQVGATNWKVDIGGPYLASLHANNALRKPYDDDLAIYMDIGDTISAQIISFDRTHGPFLTTKERGLGKLRNGMLLEISPAKVPRVIGRKGSMINMIKNETGVDILIGQNGRIWLKSNNPAMLRLAIRAIRKVEEEAHTTNLTDRIHEMLENEKKRGNEQ